MPSKTKENFNPIYGYRKNVFVINDVDLIVPPTNINIQTEDLTWQWKALRQKASTKIPSGSGQVACQVSIPFTGSMVLDMHRLIVEFRHSPFCYIENRFLRETIVPHWPATQHMAFTMTNMSVAPMQGTSDTWVMTLDLTWFNYFPYVHNWFYRHDWHTLPVQANGAKSQGKPVELTIGWDWEDGVKVRRQNILPTLIASQSKEVPSWDSIQQSYNSSDLRTIEDMELAFRGEIYDSMPMPTRMARAHYVKRPSHSKIYTRYINFLQRDALMESFNINVEDLANSRNPLLGAALFSALKINEDRYTYGLHNGPADVDNVIYQDWLNLKNEVTSQMNKFHREMYFHFFAYQEIRLPKEYNERIAAAHQAVIPKVNKLSRNASVGGDWLVSYYPGDDFPKDRYRLRQGFSTDVQRSSILGKPGSDTPMPVGELRVTSRLKWRTVADRNRLYPGRNYDSGYMHWGTDFGAPEGSPVFAIQAGKVGSIRLTSSANGNKWRFYDVSTKAISYSIADSEDFTASIQRWNPKIAASKGKVNPKYGHEFPVGTFIKSVKYSSGWYYVDGSATGNKITIQHNDGSYSNYLHLHSVADGLSTGQEIQAGQKIGIIGNTGFLSKSYIDHQGKAAEAAYREDETYRQVSLITSDNTWSDGNGEDAVIKNAYGFSRHLHFEYWEPYSLGQHRDPEWDGDPDLEEDWRGAAYGPVPVDPVGAFKQCDPTQAELTYISPPPLPVTQTEVKEALVEEAKESQEEDEVVANVTQILDGLWADGWYYYDRDSSIKNVWWKHHVLQVKLVNEDSLSEGFLSDPLVVTAVAGGLQNIVANIPILGHEFPTQQHLGSIEPFYSFEFCSKDFEGQGTQYLAGISKKTEMLLGMRSLLHANARNFRPITDSWCVAVDSFVTRLLGTYKESDVREAVREGEEPVITDVDVKRRMLNTRSNSMTVPGSPGLSCHTLDFMETNPYVQQSITAIATSSVDKEEAHKKILDAVYNLKFEDSVKEVLNKVLIAQLAGANTMLPGEEDYGQITLDYVNHPGSVAGYNVAAYRDSNDKDWLVFGDDFTSLSSLPGSIGDLAGSTHNFGDKHPSFQGINAVPLDQVFGMDGVGGVDQIAKYGKKFDEQKYTIKDGVKIDNYITPRQYDITSILNESRNSQLIGQIPLEKILMYSQVIHTLVDTASHLLAEDQSSLTKGTIQPGGNNSATVQEDLYGLPVKPSLYKYFSYYILKRAMVGWRNGPNGPFDPFSFDPRIPVSHITENPNWISFPKTLKNKRELDAQLQRYSVNTSLVGQSAEDAGDTLTSAFRAVIDPVLNLITGDAFDEGAWADLYTSRNEEALEDVALNFMSFLPLMDLAEERFKSFVTSSFVGDLALTIDGKESSTPVFANTAELLKETLRSCGNFRVAPVVDRIAYIVEPWDSTTSSQIEDRNERDSAGATDPTGITKFETEGTFSFDKEIQDSDATLAGSNNLTGNEIKSEDQFFGPDGSWFSSSLDKSSTALALVWKAKGFKKLNSTFTWYVDAALEQDKIAHFKRELAKYAEEMRNDIDILRAFDLTEYSNMSVGAAITGSPALPDMDLPHHPYYGTLTACPPDFYMWNMYDDGNAHNEAVMDAIHESMEDIITNCYNSINNITKNKKSYKPSQDTYVLEPEAGDVRSATLNYTPEASDNGKAGTTAFPFYPNPNSTEAISNHIGAVDAATKRALEKANAARTGSSSTAVPTISKEQAELLHSTSIDDVRVSNVEGPYGEGGGIQYPRRMTTEAYDELFAKVKTVENMFGSRNGYLDEREIPGSISERLSGTVLEREDSPTHQFDRDSLSKIAKESAADIFGQKRQMRRAYPTFKLFFVEEDEFESRLLNFDDFYSYNGVTSFTIEQSRKSPADHAVVTLLNVAGTLDGTKRDAVVDMDYFADSSKIKVPREASTRADDPTTQGTALDQPFGALVLRPGLNVQLRVGYSNDPDLLEVMLNGRVVDVTWNSGGDRAEILIQSFGTELQQILKGTSSNNDSRSFATTHHLLGALMLEPELVHFGRWEFGKLYQVGEGNDARLDFYDYSRESNFGTFRAPAAIVDWFLDHPIITSLVAIGGAAVAGRVARPVGALVGRIPGIGRMFSSISSAGFRAANATSKAANGSKYFKWVSNWLDNIGAAGPSAAGYRNSFVRLLGSRTGNAVTTASKVTRADIKAIMAARAAETQLRLRSVIQAGERAGGASLEFAVKATRIQAQAIKKATDKSVEEAATILAKADNEIGNLIFQGQWGYNPLATLAGQSTGLLSQAGSIGRASVKNVFSGVFTKQPVFLAGTAVAATATAPLDWALSAMYDATFKRLKAYFRTKQVSLFLSPQDDNLFPPHPKDYMNLDEDGFIESVKKDLTDYVIKQGISAFTTSDQMGYQGLRWFRGDHPLDKRAVPDEYNYKLMSTTIWDVFHEMTLRHPGWIYAARPYGKEFRYTMFFGVPSQRYWSRGADNEFIKRANDLSRVLSDSTVTVDEYRLLYGDIYDDGEQSYPLEEYDKILEEQIINSYIGNTEYDSLTEVRFESPDLLTGTLPPEDPNSNLETAYDAVEMDKELDSARKIAYTARALREYLKALELRFKPFRRYHSITSEEDIVWNGLISSENAVYNGVDVSYFDTDAKRGDTPVSSALFKAHAYIPDHKLRVAPLPISYNTRGYTTAMRYGQGALLHSMREMYRGEIIVLGNHRIRPWDIGILSDSYNDMVGPFEVEQVVHQFSYETGFITEIKPSAVVIANETSSFPIIEAMKVASLAIKDVKDQFEGLGPTDPGAKFKALEWALAFGGDINEDEFPGAAEEYRKYLEERAKELTPVDLFSDPDTGETDLDEIRQIEEDVGQTGRKVAATVGAAAGGVLAFTGAALALKGIPLITKGAAFSRRTSAFATGASVLGGAAGGAGGAVFALNKTTPSISWLLGSPILFMQCLRNDSIMLVPLMKSGQPIVSGVSLRDPGSIWNSYKGELGRWIEDHVDGTKDLTSLWRIYGMHAWRRNATLENLGGEPELTGETL